MCNDDYSILGGAFLTEYSYEKIGGGITIKVSDNHTFGTDSFLLSYFATPKNKDKVCDLGTGCGIVPLLWFREPATTPAYAYALDIQPQAIDQLKESLSISKVENFQPVLGDLKDIKELLPAGELDVVTCNPPYKAEGTGVMSTSSADKVARHETMCSIDDVASAAAWLLRFGGRFAICQLPERLPDVITAMRSNGIEPKRMRFVQNDPYSAPWLVLVEGRRGGKPFLTVEAPLIMRENGNPSKEMDKIYGMYGKVL